MLVSRIQQTESFKNFILIYYMLKNLGLVLLSFLLAQFCVGIREGVIQKDSVPLIGKILFQD